MMWHQMPGYVLNRLTGPYALSPHDFAVEVGGGFQVFFPFFIFSPEIKYSQGIGNMLIYNSNLDRTNTIEKVLSRAFTISLHFEG